MTDFTIGSTTDGENTKAWVIYKETKVEGESHCSPDDTVDLARELFIAQCRACANFYDWFNSQKEIIVGSDVKIVGQINRNNIYSSCPQWFVNNNIPLEWAACYAFNSPLQEDAEEKYTILAIHNHWSEKDRKLALIRPNGGVGSKPTYLIDVNSLMRTSFVYVDDEVVAHMKKYKQIVQDTNNFLDFQYDPLGVQIGGNQ